MNSSLNTAFPVKVIEKYSGQIHDYILPKGLEEFVTRQNVSLKTGFEVRLQEVFTEEIWKKLDSLGLRKFDWQSSKILDVACGGGFLSYHLLKRAHPAELTLNDISPTAIEEAKKLLGTVEKTKISFYLGDILNSSLPPESFDMIIGNSFMHHFYDVPKAVKEFERLLKPGGVFVTLHEPTPAAVALESGNPALAMLYVLRGKKYIEDIRKIKGTSEMVNPGGDVWLFEPKKLATIFERQNFAKVTFKSWHLFRSIFAGCLSLHLSEKRPRLGRTASSILDLGIKLDSILNKFLPAACFGSLSIAAIKKYK
jgi:ubiquinone/menaquinone biosynthesis C-methylase UbiE